MEPKKSKYFKEKGEVTQSKYFRQKGEPEKKDFREINKFEPRRQCSQWIKVHDRRIRNREVIIMLSFIKANLATIIISALIVLLIVATVRYLIRRHKTAGLGPCGNKCSGCPDEGRCGYLNHE